MTDLQGVVTVTEQVRSYIANAKILAKDGLTVAEFGELATELMRVLVAAMDSIFSHRSVRGAFQALNGIMGPSPALHLEAAGVMADQVLTVADGIDGGAARVGKDAASEIHGVSLPWIHCCGAASHRQPV